MSAGLYAHLNPPSRTSKAARKRACHGDRLKSAHRKQIEELLPGQRALRFGPDVPFKSVQAAAHRAGHNLNRHYVLRMHPVSLHTCVWRVR